MRLERRLPAVLGVLLALGGCRCSDSSSPLSGVLAPPELPLLVSYGSEKKTWLEEQARAFNATSPKTRSGKRVRVRGEAMGSGEAVQGILAGTLQPHVFSPASGAYVALLNQSWLSTAGHTQPVSPAGEPVVLSPLVIALWRPMAEALGWPQKQLGWANLVAVSADKRGWAAFGHPEWGEFKLGHTHPEFSNSGLLAVLAEAYAGAGKKRGLTVGDLRSKKVRDFVASVESSIVHYGKSTGFFSDKMLERGPGYLSAAVLYENVVIESYAKNRGTPVVAVYPVEGTFWSDHPYAVLDAPWVTPEHREAAEAFLAFLKARPAQQRALELGFRPADPAVPIGAPVDAAHGVDPKQPQSLLEVPDAATLRELLDAWQAAKRPADVVLLFDKSGSMNGQPLEEAKRGAQAFLNGLRDRDEASVVFFDHRIHPPVGPVELRSGRKELLARIDSVIAEGGTALYDAIDRAYSGQLMRAQKDRSRIHAVVVMTDGRDESSALQLSSLKDRLRREESPVKIFTIAYGEAADPAVLAEIAESAQGQGVKGSAQTIVQVYQDLASFF